METTHADIIQASSPDCADTAPIKYMVRHKPSGKLLNHQMDSNILLPTDNPSQRNMKPSEWENIREAALALVSTPFGIKNMEIVEKQSIQNHADH